MIRIKNIRPGIVLVPGNRLRLPPGGIASVEAISPEIERAITAGLVVRLGESESSPAPDTADEQPKPESDPIDDVTAEPTSPPEASPEDLSRLPQAEAIQKIATERDPKRLRALLAVDKRPRVQDAIRRRLSEIEPVAPR